MENTSLPAVGNGHSTAAETIYALSDEQILDIAEDVSLDDASISPSGDTIDDELGADASTDATNQGQEKGSAQGVTSGTGNAVASVDAKGVTPAPPEWLAQAMGDPQRGGEARQFWESAQSAQRDSAEYRATFPTLEAARDAAGRAEQLASLDRAYFGATGIAPRELSASREALAQRLMQENPGAFREMLAAGLRAVGVRDVAGVIPQQSSPARQGDIRSTSQNVQTPATPGLQDAARDEELRHYAAFERAANDELDRAVRPEIAHMLERALPASRANDSGRAIQERLAGMVRNEIEVALKQDRALGEQVAQLLGAEAAGGQGAKGRRFDEATRAQVVRLIAARAASLVPSAARRVIGEWTQSALSAHRGRNLRGDGGGPRVDSSHSVAARASSSEVKRDAVPAVRSSSAPLARNDSRDTSRRDINYRALSDEDILNL